VCVEWIPSVRVTLPRPADIDLAGTDTV
jgi:hypothetical protein